MALYSGRILIRRGDEINYDPEKLMPGEWALSTDKKIVRICVSPGEVIRMATYDAFEEDMEKIEEILATCQSIQEAVIKINTEISQKADAVAEYTAQAKNYSESALTSANNAHTSEINAKTSETNAKLSEINAKASENAALESKEIAVNKASEAAQSESNASQYALSADNSSASARISAENARVSEQASSLKAQEAEAFRNEAERFRNEAELFTPDGYDVFVQIAAETKERVDDLEENLETVSSDVETNKSDIEKVSFKVDTVIEKADLRIKETASGESIHLTDSADSKVVEFALYGNAKQDGTPSPDNEVDVEISGASGSVLAESCGKNLINQEDANTESIGYGFWIYGDIAIDVNAGAKKIYLPKGTYTFSFKSNITQENSVSTNFYNKKLETILNVTSGVVNGYNESIFTLEEDVYAVRSYTNTSIIISEIQIEKGAGRTEYEPYKETSSTIPTPNGLAGIDVDSGGNYTDENGQQRVCTTIVKYADGSGEYIQRIAKKYLSEITDWYFPNWPNPYCFQSVNDISDIKAILGYGEKANILCNRFMCKTVNEIANNIVKTGIGQYSKFIYVSIEGITTSSDLKQYFANNETYIYYELAEPIRTPLTAEQIAEIEKLGTFYPVTNIYNDADCGMKVTYIVDAKRYIDNKIAELAAAMVNSI